jgi:uncharacterized membrane protein
LSLLLLCRVLHIAVTCTSLGGLFYARMVLWPMLEQLPDSERESFLAQIIRRFAYIKWTGVIVVAVTGVIQWLWTYPYVLDQTSYLIYFGIKMIGAIGLFSITFLLALPVDKLHWMQKRRAIWSGLNIICGLTILVGSALMRTVARSE